MALFAGADRRDRNVFLSAAQWPEERSLVSENLKVHDKGIKESEHYLPPRKVGRPGLQLRQDLI
jgi:hypothetical protein